LYHPLIYQGIYTFENIMHALPLLVYEMNSQPLNIDHRAPFVFAARTSPGFKHIEWIEAIEFVDDFRHLGSRQGGYNGDREFYSW
jgi:DMSO/TMAO reductase YedYZ molybdopterin-dependent catalytic subunit